jgi:hypothetical protein
MDEKFIQDRYNAELARKEQLRDALGTPVSVLIALGGLIVAMAGAFSYTSASLTSAFLVLLSADAIAFGVALYYFANAYHGQEYAELNSLTTLRDHELALVKYHAALGQPATTAASAFKDFVQRRMLEAADQNRSSNVEKLGHLHKAIECLFFLLIAAALSAVPYALDQAMSPPKILTVHIDNAGQPARK